MNTTENTNATAFNLTSFDANKCTTIEHYVEFVRQWRKAYNILSRELRYNKLDHRASVSAAYRADKQPNPALAAQLAAMESPTAEELKYVTDRTTAYLYSDVATWMLQARKDGKEWVKATFPVWTKKTVVS
jgi:bisphosphoglycerate-dependent phosphoglycerate mutase